ncbi:MAG: hypothetical protein NTU90_05045, partial [Proteobacteria bacterium]|nr:hypothetical protein [Pseudomonadota bacterium]
LFLLFKGLRFWSWLTGKDKIDFFPANPLFPIKTGKLADFCYYPLARSPDRSDGLDQRPVLIVFSIKLTCRVCVDTCFKII